MLTIPFMHISLSLYNKGGILILPIEKTEELDSKVTETGFKTRWASFQFFMHFGEVKSYFLSCMVLVIRIIIIVNQI